MTLRRPSNPRPGFTLVELLVVIAIIALLIGMLVPALRSARNAARDVACRANQRSIGVCVCPYTADSDGVFPYTDNAELIGRATQRGQTANTASPFFASQPAGFTDLVAESVGQSLTWAPRVNADTGEPVTTFQRGDRRDGAGACL
ncbi:MAG: type II secretion system protein [Planctomycetota bacterium]